MLVSPLFMGKGSTPLVHPVRGRRGREDPFSDSHSERFLLAAPSGSELDLGQEGRTLPSWMTRLSHIRATYLAFNQYLSSKKAVLVVTVAT